MELTEAQKKTLSTALKQSGVFITSGLERPNVMSTHWGALGNFWNKQIFILPVRPSKLSHDLIDETKTFAVSVPIKDMRNEIIQCDHLSGFYTNKFEVLNLHPRRAKNIDTYVLGECGLILECRVVFSADMSRDQVDPSLRSEMYSCKDFHTMYFAEVIDAYDDI